MKINRYIIAILIIVLVVFIAVNCGSKGHKPKMKTTHVDCEAGQSLAAIVKQSQEYTRVVVKKGTCQDDEIVVVERNNIVIDGNGAVLDGRNSMSPVIVVQAKNVVIRDLTITRGMYGIVIKKEATAVLKNVNANGNSGSGIVVGKAMRLPNPDQNPNQIPMTKPITLNQSTDNSLSDLFKEVVEKSSFDMSIVQEARAETDSEACRICPLLEGIDPIAAEFTTFCGIVNANNNGDSGIPVNSSGTLEICGNVNAGNTEGSLIQQYGLAVHDGSTINIYGFATAQSNLSDGVWIQDNSRAELFGDGVKLTSIKNQGFGLRIGENSADVSTVICHPGSKLEFVGNTNGDIRGNSGNVGRNCFLP